MLVRTHITFIFGDEKKNSFVALAKFLLQKLLNPVFFLLQKPKNKNQIGVFGICYIPQSNRIMFDAHGIIELKSLLFVLVSYIVIVCAIWLLYKFTKM